MRSYLLLLFCASLYGSNFVLGSLLLQAFPALHLSAYRHAVSSVFLLVYLKIIEFINFSEAEPFYNRKKNFR
ncbi:drug/metabolite transporter (DMT)-like permease [Paenibacillus favisporus]|uniref:Drug/metabolite transporter (DMT)-like permease n=1 Tax=Paenibacillus favisporus TaxID=221028 RepID=A0ABV2FC37_9BACL